MMIVGMFEKNLANKRCDVSWFACVFFEAGIHGLLSTLILCLQRVLSTWLILCFVILML